MFSTLFQRLSPHLPIHRLCLLNLQKASKNLVTPSMQLPSVSFPMLMKCTGVRLKSSLTGDGDDHGGKRDPNNDSDSASSHAENDPLNPSLADKYQLFEKSEEELILDYREELLAEDRHSDSSPDGIDFLYRQRPSKFDDVNLERGVDEVIDIDELVTLLQKENMLDIYVIGLPVELRYADYMIIASAKSARHLEAVTAYLTKVWKLKRHQNDPFLIVEGQNSSDWKVLDMGSIVAHLFMPQTREKYDLESLWTLGSDYDDKIQRPPVDPTVDLLEKHIDYLKSLQTTPTPVRKADMIPLDVKKSSMTRQQMKELQRQLIQEKVEPVKLINPDKL